MHAPLAQVSEEWLKTWPPNHTQHLSAPPPSHTCVLHVSVKTRTADRRQCLFVHKLRPEAVN